MAAPSAEGVTAALDELAATARGLANPDLPQPVVGHIEVRDADGGVIGVVELTWAVTHALLDSSHQATVRLREAGLQVRKAVKG